MNYTKRAIIYSVFIANLVVTVAFWWAGSGSLVTTGMSGQLIAIGRLVGLLGMILILTQLLLVGRIRYIEREYGHDNLNRLHRTIGKYFLYFILLHPLLLSAGYAMGSGISVWAQFIDFLYNWHYVSRAVIGLLLICLVVFVSVWLRKKIRYETWYFTHLLIYVAVYLIFSHQIQTADVSGGRALQYWFLLNFTVFGLVLLYRFIRPLYLYFIKHKFTVEKIVRENESVTSVYVTGKNMDDFNYESGQFANITFLDSSMWYTHPFSFSQAPNGKNIRFSIKNVGDYTSQVPSLKEGTGVIIDGPLGVFTERKAIKDKFLFIAGGIGITPIRSMVESLAKKDADMIMLYGARTPDDAVFQKELDELRIKYHVVLSHIKELDGSERSEDQDKKKYEYGYIESTLISRLVTDIKEREIYLCGPTKMMELVVKELISIGVSKEHIHYERFAY